MIPIVMGTVVGHICYNLGVQGPGWQKLCEGTKGLRRKVWTWTKILSPNICYIVVVLRFVAIYTIFGNLWAKKVIFGSKTVFLGQEMHYYMIYIAYHTESNLQMLQLRAKDAFVAKKIYALDEFFYGHFCPRQKAVNFCRPQ